MSKSPWLNATSLQSMQKGGKWLQCFSHTHILAVDQPLEMLTWVELLPRLLVLLPLVLLVLPPLLSSSLQQHQAWVMGLQKEWDDTGHISKYTVLRYAIPPHPKPPPPVKAHTPF